MVIVGAEENKSRLRLLGKRDVTAHFLRGSSPPCLPDQRRKFNGPPIEWDDSKTGHRTARLETTEQRSAAERSPSRRHQSVSGPYGGSETRSQSRELPFISEHQLGQTGRLQSDLHLLPLNPTVIKFSTTTRRKEQNTKGYEIDK